MRIATVTEDHSELPLLELPAFDRPSWQPPLADEISAAASDSGDLDDFDEDDFDDEFDDDFEEELEDEYELSEFEDVTEDDLADDEDDDLGTLGGDFVDEDAEPEEAPLAEEAEEPPPEGKKPKKGKAKPADEDED